MKLAACYTVFNGMELLEKSIKQIYNHVDVIVICYQTTSNTGQKNDGIVSYFPYYDTKMKVVLIEFTPDLGRNTKRNELNKHNLMINASKKAGCSHFFMSAVDHFYEDLQIIYAKYACIKYDYDATFTKMYTYYKEPTWQLTPIEDYCMPFICKLYENTAVERCSAYPVYVDPSVQVNTFKKWYLFNENEVMLHHYSMIRQDIRSKFKSAAASVRWTPELVDNFIFEYENYDVNINPGITYFGGRKIKKVLNYFGIDLK